MVRLIGRDPEVRTFVTAVERVRRGTGVVLVLEGEPGIGKTRLLREFAAIVDGDWSVFSCGCSEMEIDRPFAAIAAGLDDFLDRHNDSDDPLPEELFEAKDLLKQAQLTGSPLENQGQRIARLVVDGFHDIARTKPVLVMIDDAQWIDDASAELVWGFVRRHTKSVLTVTAFRASSRPSVQTFRRSLDARGAANIALQPLPQMVARELAFEVAGSRGSPQLDKVLDSAGGNPLYITELLRRSGTEDDSEHLANGPAFVPSTLRSLVSRRLLGLTAMAQELLQDAALLGLSFDVHELAQLREKGVTEVLEALLPALDIGILIEAGDRMAFRHAVVQTIVADHQTESFRRQRHGVLSRRLELFNARWTRVAEHLLLSSPVASAEVVRVFRFASREVRPLAIASGLIWLERALAFSLDDNEKLDLRMDIAESMVLLGRVVEADQLCAELLGQVSSDEKTFRIRSMLAAIASMAGQTKSDEAIVRIRNVLALLPPKDDRRVDILGWLCFHLLFDGKTAEAGDKLREAQELINERPHLGNTRRFHEAQSIEALLRGDGFEAVRLARVAVELFDFHADALDWIQIPQFCLAMAMISTAKVGELLSVLHQGMTLCENSGLELARLHLEPLVPIAHLLAGDLGLASDAVIANRDRDSNEWRTVPTETALAAFLAMLDDDMTRATALADDALNQLLAGGQALSGDFTVLLIALVKEANGDAAGARDLLVAVWELIARDLSLPNITPDLVRLTLDSEPDFARGVTERIEQRAAGSGAPVDRANALACRALVDRSPALLEDAAVIWDSLDWVLQPTRIREFALDMASLEGAPQAQEQIDVLTRAWTRMEARRPVRLLELRSRHLGGRRKRTSRALDGPDSLTQTERAVVRLVAEGLTNKEIAGRLFVSHRTVDTHVSHSLAKLGVASRVHLARMFQTTSELWSI